MKRGFIIDSLPRTGSTTLAQLVSCHPQITCLLEPFHPRRYNGQYYRMALEENSVVPALNLIWHRWSGIKHVWQSEGWPFHNRRELNDELISCANRVIWIERRNLLRRVISNAISRQLDFWIGTAQEFRAHLENAQLKELSPIAVLEQIRADKRVIQERLTYFRRNQINVKFLVYEELFGEGISLSEQFSILNSVFEFLGYPPMAESELKRKCAPLFDRRSYQWASDDIYSRIPQIEQLADALVKDDVGKLFEQPR